MGATSEGMYQGRGVWCGGRMCDREGEREERERQERDGMRSYDDIGIYGCVLKERRAW